MKTLIYLLPAVLVLFSCQKEDKQAARKTDTKKVTQHTPSRKLLESKGQVEQKKALAMVSAIRNSAASNQYNKSAASSVPDMNMNDAIYYVEGSLNAEYFRSFHSQREFADNKFNYSAPAYLDKNGIIFIKGAELINTFDFFKTKVNTNTPAGKLVLVTDVWISGYSSSNVTFEMEVLYSETGGSTAPLGTSDEWWPINKDGKCNDELEGIMDAADRLEELYNWYKPEYWNGSSSTSTGGLATECAPNTSGTWFNVDDFYSGPSYSGNYPFHGCQQWCQSQADMEDHLADGFDLMDNEIPAGNRFISCTFWSDYLLTSEWCDGQPTLTGSHFITIKFGELHCGPLPW